MLVGDILRQNSQYFPKRPCLIQENIRLTFAEVDARVNSLANGLLALGLNRGDRLAVLLNNCYQYPEIYFALARTGIIGVPLNVRLAVPELVAYLRYTKPRAIIVAPNHAHTGNVLLQEVPGLDLDIGLGEGHPFDLDYDALIRSHSSKLPNIPLSPDDTYLLGATSGTTGIPKAAVLTHRNAVTAMLIWYSEIIWPQFGPMLQCAPQFFNPGGPANMGSFLKGGPIIVLPQFTPQAFLETVQRERPVFTILPSTMLSMVANSPDAHQYDLSSLRGIVTGGSPPPASLVTRATELFGNILYPTYGMCETYSSGTLLRRADLVTDGPPEAIKRLSSAGHPAVGVEVRIVNDEGQDVKQGTGEVGEIIVRGQQVSPAYWDMPEETAASHRDGWFHTGDLATQDQEGYIYIVDRKKDMIITGGINVYSVEVEAAVSSHPAVLQVAVFGVPDKDWGEAVKAIVVLRPGATATEQEISEHCKRQLASYKKPKSVEFRSELPMSGTGKILKRALREEYWAGFDRRVN